MIWNIIYSRRSRKPRGGPKDDFDLLIDVIEEFAPSGHVTEREVHFYNYRIMAPYPKPLLALLKTIAQRERLSGDRANFARELFVRLKDFYDPRDRLSPDEAKKDFGLQKKFQDLFLFFYGEKTAPAVDGDVDPPNA